MRKVHDEQCHQADMCAPCIEALIQQGIWCSTPDHDQELEI